MGSANFQHRLQLLFCALFSLGLGLGFIFSEFAVFAYLVMLLPWLLSIGGILLWISGIQRKSKRNYVKIVLGAIIFCIGIALFRWAYLRDPMLWYFFVLYLVVSAYINMRPAWHPGLEKHAFARYIGGVTVWGFAALLLFMPRSGLSDALTLLGCFTAAWGVYQILLPPCRE